MKKHDIRYLKIAEDDLNEIVDYLLEHSVNAANTFVDDLEKSEEHLSMFPEMGILSKDRKLRSKGYRMVLVGDYLMFYILHDDSVFVMRIIHGKRNYLALL